MSSESASAPRERVDRATAEEEDGDESEDSSLWERDRETERERERERKRQREAERTLERETERERERERDRERERRDRERDRRGREHDREHHRDRDREREDRERNSIDLTAEAPPEQSEGSNAEVSDATPPLAMRVGAQSITDDVSDNDCEIKASCETRGIKPEAHDASAPAPAPAAIDSMSVPHRASNREAQRGRFSRAFDVDSDDSNGSDEYDELESDSDSSGHRDGSDDSNDDDSNDDDDDEDDGDGDDYNDDAGSRHQTLDVQPNIGRDEWISDESGADSSDGSNDVDSDNEDIIDEVDDNDDADADISANDRDVGTGTPERSNLISQLTSSSMASMLSLILSRSSNPVPNVSESVRTPALQNGGPLREDVAYSKAAPSTSRNDTHRGVTWLLRAYVFVLACGVLVAFGLYTAFHYDKMEPLRAATRVLWSPTRNFIPGCKIYAPKCSAMPERGGSPFLEREPVLPLASLSGWTINSTRTATALSCAKAAKSWHIACNNLVSEPVWSSFLDGTAPVFRYPPPQSAFNITSHAKSIGVCFDAEECAQIGDCLRDAGFVEEHLRTPDGFRDRLRRCLPTLKQRLIWSKHVRFPHPFSWTPWRAGQARHAPTF